MYTLLSTGDVPGASSYFNPLLQQTIIPCTSATRPSSPGTGWMVYETDTNRYSSWNGSAWVTFGQTAIGTYTPTLTATTTSPTMGTGNTVSGRYTLFNGKWCTVRGTIKFGTTGMLAGSGTYEIAAPFASSSAISVGEPNVGSVSLFDSSTNALGAGNCRISSGASVIRMNVYGSASINVVTDAFPWVWNQSDFMSFAITYEIA